MAEEKAAAPMPTEAAHYGSVSIVSDSAPEKNVADLNLAEDFAMVMKDIDPAKWTPTEAELAEWAEGQRLAEVGSGFLLDDDAAHMAYLLAEENTTTVAVADSGMFGTKAPPVPPRLKVTRADAVKISRVRYLWEGRIPLGAMTLMPGEEGIGKTTVGVRLIADITKGILPGEMMGTPRDVVVLSLEDGLADVYAPRLQEAGADLSRVHIVRARLGTDGAEHDVIIPRDLDVLGDELVTKVDAALVWIDSLVTTLPNELKSIAYKDTAKVLKAVGAWAEGVGVSVVAPWHLNKSSGSSSGVRIMDSRAFRTAVRSMLMVVRDPDAPEGVSQGIVALDKANGGTLAIPGLRYRIRSASYVVEETDTITGEIRDVAASCGVAEWIGEVSPGQAEDLVERSLSPGMDRQNDTATWLKRFLDEHGPTPRKDVIDAGNLVDHSLSALKRAAARLGIQSKEVSGQHPDGRPFRHAVWSLPPQSAHFVPPSPNGPTGPPGEG